MGDDIPATSYLLNAPNLQNPIQQRAKAEPKKAIGEAQGAIKLVK